MDGTVTVSELKAAIVAFAAARDWEPYHSPKNLAMALASECGELCGELRWLTADESRSLDPRQKQAVADELADVANIVLLLAHHCDLDLSDAVAAKLVKNAVKYPAPPG